MFILSTSRKKSGKQHFFDVFRVKYLHFDQFFFWGLYDIFTQKKKRSEILEKIAFLPHPNTDPRNISIKYLINRRCVLPGYVQVGGVAAGGFIALPSYIRAFKSL